MKSKFILSLCAIFLSSVTLISFAAEKQPNSELFTLQVTADKTQSFFGVYLTDKGLTKINQKTPFEVKLKTSEVRVMLGSNQPNSKITVKLFRPYSVNGKFQKPLVSTATGRNIVMCESNQFHNGVNGCNVSVKVGT